MSCAVTIGIYILYVSVAGWCRCRISCLQHRCVQNCVAVVGHRRQGYQAACLASSQCLDCTIDVALSVLRHQGHKVLYIYSEINYPHIVHCIHAVVIFMIDMSASAGIHRIHYSWSCDRHCRSANRDCRYSVGTLQRFCRTVYRYRQTVERVKVGRIYIIGVSPHTVVTCTVGVPEGVYHSTCAVGVHRGHAIHIYGQYLSFAYVVYRSCHRLHSVYRTRLRCCHIGRHFSYFFWQPHMVGVVPVALQCLVAVGIGVGVLLVEVAAGSHLCDQRIGYHSLYVLSTAVPCIRHIHRCQRLCQICTCYRALVVIARSVHRRCNRVVDSVDIYPVVLVAGAISIFIGIGQAAFAIGFVAPHRVHRYQHLLAIGLHLGQCPCATRLACSVGIGYTLYRAAVVVRHREVGLVDMVGKCPVVGVSRTVAIGIHVFYVSVAGWCRCRISRFQHRRVQNCVAVVGHRRQGYQAASLAGCQCLGCTIDVALSVLGHHVGKVGRTYLEYGSPHIVGVVHSICPAVYYRAAAAGIHCHAVAIGRRYYHSAHRDCRLRVLCLYGLVGTINSYRVVIPQREVGRVDGINITPHTVVSRTVGICVSVCHRTCTVWIHRSCTV